MSLSMAAQAMHGKYQGADLQVAGVTTDTRSIKEGELFVALQGPNFDGHNFITQAEKAGACAAVISRDISAGLPLVRVEDTRIALGDLASAWRNQLQGPLIAVTGSNGKTTVKEMAASIMGMSQKGLVTRGNLNNDIGVPLTLLRLDDEDRFAVIEMGMNHAGEIAYLTSMARPDIAVITNAAEAHLEGLGSVEAIARAKGEIFAGLNRRGTAVINADDDYCELWKQLAEGNQIITFGINQPADVRCEYELKTTCSLINLVTNHGEITMRLSILGRHNVLNAMAASAASIAAGATLEDVKAGLEKLRAVSGRLETREGINGSKVIDDTYNANPASVAAGIEVLRNAGGETILVLGDMAELGDMAPAIHKRVGELAKRYAVTRLFTLGQLAANASQGYGKGARHYDNVQLLVEDLVDCLNADVTVLIKGSRVMRMENVVEGISGRK